MANITSTELLFPYDAASCALYIGNLALGQLSSTLVNSTLFGVLTLPRSRRDVRNVSLLLATGAMYAWTTVYFARRIRNLSHDAAATFTNAVALFSDLQSCYLTSAAAGAVSNSTQTQCTTSQDPSDLAGSSDLPPQYCAGTAALTINVGRRVLVSAVLVEWTYIGALTRPQGMLGNAILCSPACALWPRRRRCMIPIVLGSLVLATCVRRQLDPLHAFRDEQQQRRARPAHAALRLVPLDVAQERHAARMGRDSKGVSLSVHYLPSKFEATILSGGMKRRKGKGGNPDPEDGWGARGVPGERVADGGGRRRRLRWGEDPLRLDGPGVRSFFVGKNFGLAAFSLAFVTRSIYLEVQAAEGEHSEPPPPGPARTRMGSVLALTVELGVVYCVIWGFIVGATATTNKTVGALEDTDTGFEEVVYTQNPTSFVQGFWVFDLGALTPLTAIYPLLLVAVVALNKSLLFEHDRGGFERISDDAQRAPVGEPRSPTQWRRKFLLASPQSALIDQCASDSGAGVEAFALSHKRSSSGWEEVDVVSLGKGEIL
ncbi:hypothetical protein GSI_03495 [Ganoderma sinense ZZ0214-1]|uniref:Uncharacterized protein n=1 Tax=Ganoderma sinense ZZ0214-1 TaxID=1077348 RepID=A0A2G8SLS7_9APHY|nr:hypothetical protein GSI_03495 [Ganoderma sinense ZZ0214-1]